MVEPRRFAKLVITTTMNTPKMSFERKPASGTTTSLGIGTIMLSNVIEMKTPNKPISFTKLNAIWNSLLLNPEENPENDNNNAMKEMIEERSMYSLFFMTIINII